MAGIVCDKQFLLFFITAKKYESIINYALASNQH